ncbi:Nif3-like dinuclear metal center hexameric protein [Priestia koreensis]|uniref:Nif3-like dinuclear metal center hexameric protein n=1 Tax=Priestia koreensis TaxID=284581 RepID=UPI001F5AA8A4|nr:Nif3-like dinuclear metal center hexameric protein [Priestia koreensis]MCM3002513.1 Nif3-like dinuclear metal center hexameric protein [Priestia koreensis]UNL84225.1 Nif3-like dinuclear metal center hexameric protein [Priestia koreensis]
MSKTPNGYEVIQLFESFSPKSLAMEGDKIGLQIGTLNKPIHKVMVTLDVLEEVVEEAVKESVDLIIAHHPPIFRPMKNIVTDQPAGRLVEMCIKHDIAVYAAHTNLDIAEGGVNDLLADALGLEDLDILIPTQTTALKKVAVSVPKTHAEQVRTALTDAGAGHIGNYSHCTFSTPGEGTFLPEDGTKPFIGSQGTLERVEEVKVESIFPVDLQRRVVQAMIKAHPYEEVAYDIYPLDNPGKEYGLGRIGKLPEEMTLEQFAQHVKSSLDVKGLRVVGNLTDKVRKVAVLGGDGNKYITQAKFKGADVYVTGDLYFHVAHDAKALGLNVVDPGHHVEKVMMQGVTKKMKELFAEKNFSCGITASTIHTDPFTFM